MCASINDVLGRCQFGRFKDDFGRLLGTGRQGYQFGFFEAKFLIFGFCSTTLTLLFLKKCQIWLFLANLKNRLSPMVLPDVPYHFVQVHEVSHSRLRGSRAAENSTWPKPRDLYSAALSCLKQHTINRRFAVEQMCALVVCCKQFIDQNWHVSDCNCSERCQRMKCSADNQRGTVPFAVAMCRCFRRRTAFCDYLLLAIVRFAGTTRTNCTSARVTWPDPSRPTLSWTSNTRGATLSSGAPVRTKPGTSYCLSSDAGVDLYFYVVLMYRLVTKARGQVSRFGGEKYVFKGARFLFLHV